MDSAELGSHIRGLGLSYVSYGDAALHQGVTEEALCSDQDLWGALGVTSALHRAIITESLKTPESRRDAKLIEPDSSSAPAPTLPFPKDGLSLQAVQAFIERCGGQAALEGLTTTEVCADALMPLTRAAQSSYCELLRVTGAPGVGKPVAFISHAWKYKFMDVVLALKTHFQGNADPSSVIIWFDLFTNNQHGAPNLDFTWWSTTFKSAIEEIGQTVVVLTPWSNPIPFTRAWCLYEVYCTVSTGSAFDVAMTPTEQTAFVMAAQHDVNELKALVTTIDVQKSEAFNPLDLKNIFDVVSETCGFDKINEIVMERIRIWVVHAMRSAAEDAEDERTRASVLYTLGLLYDQMGMLDNAVLILEDSVERFKALDGAATHATIQKMNNLAITYDRLGRYAEAAVRFQECLANYETALGTAHVDYHNTLSSLAVVYLHQTDYEKALPLLEKCLAFFRTELGDEDLTTVNSMSTLAIVHDSLGRPADSLPLLEECIKIKRRELGDKHPDTLVSLNSLATVHFRLKNYQVGVQIFEEVLAAKRVKFGSKHFSTLKGMSTLANVYSQLGAPDEATVLFNEAWDGYQSTLGGSHVDALYCLYNMCVHYLRHDRFTQALPFCKRMAELVDSVWDADDPRVEQYKVVYRDCLNFVEEEAKLLEKLPRTLLHARHEHSLEKVCNPYEGSSMYCCDLCGKSGSGWVYHCKLCGFDVDLRCAEEETERQVLPNEEAVSAT